MLQCVLLWYWDGVGFATQTVLHPVLGWGGVGFATPTMLQCVLSVGLGWSGVRNTDRVTSCVGLGWGGIFNTDRVTCSLVTCYVLRPVCGVGWALQHKRCYVRFFLWVLRGVGGCNTDHVVCGPVCGDWSGVGFAAQTVLRAVLSVVLGWGGLCNTDCVMCGLVCGGGVGWGLQQRPCYVLYVGLGLREKWN